MYIFLKVEDISDPCAKMADTRNLADACFCPKETLWRSFLKGSRSFPVKSADTKQVVPDLLSAATFANFLLITHIDLPNHPISIFDAQAVLSSLSEELTLER